MSLDEKRRKKNYFMKNVFSSSILGRIILRKIFEIKMKTEDEDAMETSRDI